MEAGVEEDHLDPRVDTDSDVDEHGIRKPGGDGDLDPAISATAQEMIRRISALSSALRGFVDLRQKARGRSAVMAVGFEAASLIHQRKSLMCGLQCIASPGATGVCPLYPTIPIIFSGNQREERNPSGLYPIALRLDGQPCLVVGAGSSPHASRVAFCRGAR